MRRKPLNTTSRSKLSKLAKPLANLAMHLADSGSRLERRFWKKRLFNSLTPMLEGRSESTLNQTLEYLYTQHYRAYDELAFAIENTVESPNLSENEDILLLAIPVMAWSTFNIPSGCMDESVVEQLVGALKSSVLSEHAHLVLTNLLFSPDQLPENYTGAAELARQLGHAAKERMLVRIDPDSLPETQSFLSDVRYLIGAVAVDKEKPVFKWQEESSAGVLVSKDEVLAHWQDIGGRVLQKLMAGCSIQLMLPNGLYNACREAEKEARVYSVRASIAFLENALDVSPEDIEVNVGAFVDRGEVEEYRLGFSVKQGGDVVHGVVWPLIGEEYGNEPDPVYEKDITSEPDNPVIRLSIETLLKEVGIKRMNVLEERFPLEYCEDCGAPLYPNSEGELLHAELPEESEMPGAMHLH